MRHLKSYASLYRPFGKHDVDVGLLVLTGIECVEEVCSCADSGRASESVFQRKGRRRHLSFWTPSDSVRPAAIVNAGQIVTRWR